MHADSHAIIVGAAKDAVIVLEHGEHVFNKGIVITRDDVTLRGESEAGTTVKFMFDNANVNNGITIASTGSELVGKLAASTVMTQNFIVVGAGHGIEAGDTLAISQQNDQALRATGLYNNVSSADWAKFPLREAIVEVTAVIGDKVYFAGPIQQEFIAGKATVTQLDLLEGVSLSNFTVKYGLGQANDYDFTNPLAKYADFAAISAWGTYDLNISNISVLDAASNAFAFRDSIGIQATSLSTDGSIDKGDGGAGYGIEIAGVSGSSFTDLHLFNNRHAFVFSSWHAEANNYVQISATNRDVNFHGGMDRGNTVVVANQVLDYKPELSKGSSEQGSWSAVSPGGSNHPVTQIWTENVITHAYAIGADRNDELHAVNSGGYLDGRAGSDRLFGGAGADTLIGGDGMDTIAGDGGNDVIDAGGSADSIAGGDGDDHITAGLSSDIVDGGAGNDTLLGGDGADILRAGIGNDFVDGGLSTDLLYGGHGNDVLFGGDGLDTLHGGDGNDVLRGGNQKDVIHSGAGNDIVEVWAGDQYDTVVDFDLAHDRLLIHAHREFDSFAELKLETVDGGVQVTYGSGTDWGRLILQGLDVSDMHASLFTFDTF